MQLLIFRALWGMTGTLAEQFERIAGAGYDGIEFWPEQLSATPAEIIALAERYQLRMIVGTRIPTHADIEPALKRLAEFPAVKINVQCGWDYMSREAGSVFFEEALRVEAQIGLPVVHETHRGCIFFTPWDTLYYLRQFDTLKVNADYSHWVNVCERLPDDQPEALDVANRRARHIHGRVGYEEGPQAADPSAPEYATHLAWHETQWQAILQHRRAAGDTVMTFTPEYGPPNYLHTLPHTHVPVADLWSVCLWGMRRMRELAESQNVV